MKRKLFTLLVALCATTALWANGTEIDGIYYTFWRTNAYVTFTGSSYDSGNSYSGDIIIPSTVTNNGITYNVTNIADYAFYGCTGLTSITIPNSVTRISSDAFYGCTGLTSVIIPDSVTIIASSAFKGCSSLISIEIPNSVTSIEQYAFYGCTGLTSVTIPNNVTSIGASAFSGCTSLTSVTIPSSVTSIEKSTFYGCTGLTSVTIPNSVTSIGYQAFEGCSSLNSITIPNSVTSIGSGAFSSCRNLTSITIPDNVMSIEDWTFQQCTGLTSVTIGNSVTHIGNRAFEDCTGLTSVIVGNNVSSIGELTFNGCTSLTTINIPNRVTEIGSSPFSNCTSLPLINGLRYADTYLVKAEDRTLTTYTIKEGTKWIGSGAFSSCRNLTSITIPNSVTSIEGSAFGYCTRLPSITIPNSVTSIGDRAFAGTDLTSITIPNSVTSIGIGAFEHCIGFTSITIPGSVTHLASNAFLYCTNLTSIEVDISNTHYVSINGVLYSHAKDTLVTYPEGRLGTEYTIPNTVTYIDGCAFYYCRYLTSITIPNSVIGIGNSAFSGCTSLTSVIVGNNVTSIDKWAFSGCTGLNSIIIPNSVTSIGDYAFSKVLNIIYDGPATGSPWDARTMNGYVDGYLVYLDSTKTSLLACSSSATGNIIIPNTVTNIGQIAFYECAGISSITCYAAALPSLGKDAFFDTPASIPLFVLYSMIDAYKKVDQWNRFSIQGITLNVNLEVNNDEYGDVTASSPFYYLYTDPVQISAVANYGYHFTKWSDGNTDNPRSVIVTQDTAFIAVFAKNKYTITTSTEYGTIIGAGTYDYLDTISLSAIPDLGCNFIQWSDSNTNNPRIVILTQDTTFIAEFARSYGGVCGDNLNWKYADGVLTITGTGEMYDFTEETQPWIYYRDSITTVVFSADITYIGSYAFYGLSNRAYTQLVLPQTVTAIGAYAFANCSHLTSISLPASLTEIADYAFSGCISVNDITSMASTRPDIYENTFNGISNLAYLYVPCDYMRSYQLNSYWSRFDIKCASAEEATTTDLTVTPGTTDATFTWPTNSSADTYTLEIKKDGVVFCTLVFNANGQLTSIAFAPSRNGANKATAATATANGYRFTVTGLSEGSHYTYNFNVKDASQKSLKTYTGEFNTNGLTPIDNVNSDASSVEKFIQNGKLYIRTANGVFDATGRMIQ